MKSSLLPRFRKELRRQADPEKAPIMQAYMKSEMPYHGVQAKPLKEICRQVLAHVDFPSAEAWRNEVLSIWRGASHREERYAALAVAEHRKAKAYRAHDAIGMYEELVVTGAWWDYVDAIASRHLGPILRNEPARMRKTMLAWSRSDDLWKRRSSIICQLKFRMETDLDLLYACIEPSLGSKEFFLQKGIGWALREYAWVNPREVRRYVRENEARLSALSKREPLKHI